jgi:toxin ParE1/3/4
MARVIKRVAAKRDLVDHFVFLGENASLEIARRFLQSANHTFEILARMPEIGASRKFRNAHFENVRMWRVNDFEKYLIFYRPLKEGAEILRVVHGARNLEDLFRKRPA